ncbi:signal peptide peptidase-like 2A isoform X1 [Centruroides vittatus]|uniref:signal peptide peptidase-like 2A isoform X1 n=1 Tax=Centruroides vittatus TaxID=120091 RepID=UPI00350F5403
MAKGTGRIVYVYVFLTIFVSQVICDYGVLSVKSGHTQMEFCMIYYPEYSSLPKTIDEDKYESLYYASTLNTCDNSSSEGDKFEDRAVLVQIQNCSLFNQAEVIKNGGGLALLTYGSTDMLVKEDPPNKLDIPVVWITNRTSEKLQDLLPDAKVFLYSPPSSNFDYSLLIIWIFAVFSVVVGSYWSGVVRHSLHLKEMSKFPKAENNSESIQQSSQSSTEGEESSLNVSPLIIVVFVICMGLMLVLLYFCFNYLVYIIIGLFVLASAISVYQNLNALMQKVPVGTCLFFQCSALGTKWSCQVRQMVLACAALALSLTWLVLRKESYSWILQDLLGISFCINLLQSIRLPNLQICTILLVLLFFYDIFFVFVTPLLTVKGESVMVEVATGGTSGEQIPMVLKVPHLTFNGLSVCRYLNYSLLGFGDILVPGLLIAYCHGFDLIADTGRVYFALSSVAYGSGLLVTFVALYLMNTPQPALLYLVPATLLPLLLAGWFRGDLRRLWWGIKRTGRERASSPEVETPSLPEVTEEAAEDAELLK